MSDSITPVKGDEGDKSVTHALNQDPQRLRWRRVAAGLTLVEAAEKAGCSKAHLSSLENGQYSARAKSLRALAAAYGCAITDLMPADAA